MTNLIATKINDTVLLSYYKGKRRLTIPATVIEVSDTSLYIRSPFDHKLVWAFYKNTGKPSQMPLDMPTVLAQPTITANSEIVLQKHEAALLQQDIVKMAKKFEGQQNIPKNVESLRTLVHTMSEVFYANY